MIQALVVLYIPLMFDTCPVTLLTPIECFDNVKAFLTNF